MIRGTTPKLRLILPFPANMLDEAYITFSQHKEVVCEKTLTDCVIEDNVLNLRLSQEDTLAFNNHYYVEIQIRAKDVDGHVIASKIRKESADRILKEGVI